MFEKLNEWLKEICGFGVANDFVHWHGNKSSPEKTVKNFYLYTRNHRYCITAIEEKDKPGYLGCGVSARKPRAGEDWTRGNDLSDGPFSEEMWQKIKNDILAYELVKIAKSVRVFLVTENEN